MIAQRGFPAVSRLLSSQFTVVGNVGAGTDSLMAYTLAANTLKRNGDALRIFCAGRCNNNANAKQVGLAMGVAGLMLIGLQNLTVSIDGSWVIDSLLIRRSATHFYFGTSLIAGTSGGAVAEHKIQVGNEGPAMNLETTAYAITAQAVGVDDNDVTQTMMFVEYVPAP